MDLGFNLKLEQTQKLIMTQELRQSIELLQYNSLELNEFLKKEIEENPILDLEDNLKEISKNEEERIEKEIDWKEFLNHYDDISYKPQVDKNQEEKSYESYTSYTLSLNEYLLNQLHLARIPEGKFKLGEYIIDSINSNGYLQATLEEISEIFNIQLEEVEELLKIIQGFEPIGVGARNLKECLLIQVKEDNDASPIAEILINSYLEDISFNRMIKIAKELNIEVSEIQKASDYIKTLEPKPGRAFNSENIQYTKYITPDASIEFLDGEWLIIINDSTGPRLKINNYYKDLLQKNDNSKSKEFLTEKLNSAMWIIKSIEQRRQTIYKVIESIIKFQNEFFRTENNSLIPLTLKDVAEDIEMHESTISRATNGKYIQTPKGLFELKYFFSTSISGVNEDFSATNIKNMIENIVNEEDKTKPYSDQKIVEILKCTGVKISRRTVAKYRDELKIPSSTTRKRFE